MQQLKLSWVFLYTRFRRRGVRMRGIARTLDLLGSLL